MQGVDHANTPSPTVHNGTDGVPPLTNFYSGAPGDASGGATSNTVKTEEASVALPANVVQLVVTIDQVAGTINVTGPLQDKKWCVKALSTAILFVVDHKQTLPMCKKCGRIPQNEQAAALAKAAEASGQPAPGIAGLCDECIRSEMAGARDVIVPPGVAEDIAAAKGLQTQGGP